MVVGVVKSHEYQGLHDHESCMHIPVRGTARDICRLPARSHEKIMLDPHPWMRVNPKKTYVAHSPQPYPPFVDFPDDAGEPVFRPAPGFEQDQSKYPQF